MPYIKVEKKNNIKKIKKNKKEEEEEEEEEHKTNTYQKLVYVHGMCSFFLVLPF